MPRNKFNKKCPRLNEEIHKTTVLHKEMISPSGVTSLLVDGSFITINMLIFLKLTLNLKQFPSEYFKPDKFILSK